MERENNGGGECDTKAFCWIWKRRHELKLAPLTCQLGVVQDRNEESHQLMTR